MNVDYYKKYEPIDGKWYITKELGSGAFGTVFEVERRDFSHMKSALKIISIPSTQSEVQSYREENYDLDDKSVTSYFYGFVEEFIKEFQLLSKLKGHSNIVSYEDHDVVKRTEGIGWDIFIRMELLTPMNKYFANNKPKQKDIIKLGIDICKALEVCQKYKIIHRDIKPSNIFVSETEEFKLGDFGVARTLEKTSSGLSKKGTYTYMAPEVYKGEAYSSNVDIYSLGIVMYKLLNNNLEPFRVDRTYVDGEKALEKRMKGLEIPKPANAEGKIAEIVLKACSYRPQDRYESPLQMRKELERVLYTDSEGQVIYLEGDEVNFERSTAHNTDGSNEETDQTKGLFDKSNKDKSEHYETEGIFEKEEKHNDLQNEDTEKTVGLFDSQEKTVVDESANNQQRQDNQLGKTKEQAEKKDKWLKFSKSKKLFIGVGTAVLIMLVAMFMFRMIFGSSTTSLNSEQENHVVVKGAVLGFHGEYSIVDNSKNKTCGVINKKGEYIIPSEFDYIWEINENLFQAKKGEAMELLDSKNNVIVSFGEYDSFVNPYYTTAASEDRIRVSKNGMYGFIDSKGDVIIPTIYKDAKIFSEGLCAVQDNESGKWGYIDKEGNLVIFFIYDDVDCFDSGLASVKSTNGKWGYIDKEGKEIIPFEYTNAEPFSEGVGRVAKETEWGELWGYISMDGNMLTGFEFYAPGEFYDGCSRAGKYEVEGYVKKDGTLLTDFNYKKTYNFKNEVAFVEKGSLEYDYINLLGESIVPKEYKAALGGYSSVDLYPVYNSEGKMGYIDKHGSVVIEATYEHVGNFIGGVAAVTRNGQTYFIDKNEKILFYGQ